MGGCRNRTSLAVLGSDSSRYCQPGRELVVMVVLAPAALLGLGTGAALGLVGGGGSILAVPALVYGLGMPIGQAVPTSLLVVAGTAAAGVLPRLRRGEVQWPVAGVFGAAGAGAAFGGAAVNRLLPERALLGAFAALMLVVGVQLLRRQPDRTARAKPRVGASIGGPACPRRCWSERRWAFSPGCSVSAAGSSSCPP